MRPIKSENDVPFVLHGNFYQNWPDIRTKGLRRDNRHYIPCVSYVPSRFGGAAASRSYEIHIYLKVGKLLKDGMRLLCLQKGQVLCSTNKNGFITPDYFEKVIDTATGCSIYPVDQEASQTTPATNFFYQPYGAKNFEGHRQDRGPAPYPPPPMTDSPQNSTPFRGDRSRHHPNSPRGSKEVAVGELFKMASLDACAKSPPRFVPSTLPFHIYSLPHQPNAIPSGFPVTNNHFNFSNFQPYNHRFSSPPQNHAAASNHNQDRQGSYKNQSHPAHFRNQNTSVGYHDNSQSRFVPTQVSRKQTPRKISSSEGQANQNGVPPQNRTSTDPPPRLAPLEGADREAGASRVDSAQSGRGNKPKKKQRNRLAANLGMAESLRHANG